jgi:small multidrug resistance pump
MSPAALLLALAIAIEVAATLLLRTTEGFTRVLPSAGVVLGYAVSTALLAKIVERLDVGLVYAVWAGAGTAIVAGAGVLLWSEPLGWLKLLSLTAVIVGVVGLNVSGAH